MARPSSVNCRSSTPAFSLIEILVVIGVIGLVLALTLPALRGAKLSADEVKQLSDLRQLGMSTQAYADTYDGSLPYAAQGATFVLHPPGESGGSVSVGGPNLILYWPALYHDVAPWPEHFDTWLAPRALNREQGWTRPGSRPTSYDYSRTLFMDHRVFQPGGESRANPFAPVLLSAVAHPSGKVAFFDWEKPEYAGPSEDVDQRVMLFVDGHAAVKSLSGGTGGSPHATPNGSLGVDYR